MNCIFHPEKEAKFIVKGNSICSDCFPVLKLTEERYVEGSILKLWREKTGYTQKELAAFLGISDSLMSYIEKNKRNLSPQTFNRLKEFIARFNP